MSSETETETQTSASSSSSWSALNVPKLPNIFTYNTPGILKLFGLLIFGRDIEGQRVAIDPASGVAKILGLLRSSYYRKTVDKISQPIDDYCLSEETLGACDPKYAELTNITALNLEDLFKLRLLIQKDQEAFSAIAETVFGITKEEMAKLNILDIFDIEKEHEDENVELTMERFYSIVNKKFFVFRFPSPKAKSNYIFFKASLLIAHQLVALCEMNKEYFEENNITKTYTCFLLNNEFYIAITSKLFFTFYLEIFFKTEINNWSDIGDVYI